MAPVSPGKDPWGNTRIGLSATAKINRKDFGLVWNAALETGGILVGDDVSYHPRSQFIKGINTSAAVAVHRYAARCLLAAHESHVAHLIIRSFTCSFRQTEVHHVPSRSQTDS